MNATGWSVALGSSPYVPVESHTLYRLYIGSSNGKSTQHTLKVTLA